MNRFAAPTVLVAVTALFLAYGRFPWSWLAGPAAALWIWALDRKAHAAAEPSPARTRLVSGEPSPVD